MSLCGDDSLTPHLMPARVVPTEFEYTLFYPKGGEGEKAITKRCKGSSGVWSEFTRCAALCHNATEVGA